MGNSMLSTDQVDFFKREGYLVVPASQHNLVSLDEIRKWTEEVLGWPLTQGKWMIYNEQKPDNTTQIMRTEKITDYHENFKNLLDGAPVRDMLKDLTGREMLLFKDKINYKLPGANGFVAHIDAPAYTHMGHSNFVEVMVAIDEQTEENGCLEVVPGSHKLAVPLANGGRLDAKWESETPFMHLPLNPGDLLMFGSVLAHRSGPNKTNQRRAALFGTYHFEVDQPDLRERYYAHRRAYFPPDNERVDGEKYEAGWKMYGYSSPFTKPEVRA